LYISTALAAALVVGALFLAGRHAPERDRRSNGEPSSADLGAQCQQHLEGILAGVDPRSLGLSSSYSDRAHDLNLWQTDCAAALVGEPIATDDDLVWRLLPAAAAEATLRPEFSTDDVAHLRNAILMRLIAEHVVDNIADPERQAVALFEHVERNASQPPTAFPALTPFEAILLGVGTPELRAWLFAELLRQIELDAVIVQPAAATPAATTPADSAAPADAGASADRAASAGSATPPDPMTPAGAEQPAARWLVGVPIGKGDQLRMLLFDPTLGLPIPGPDEAESRSVFVERPATLEEARARDDLFRRLDAPDAPYPLRSADLQTVRIGLIGTSSLWSNRVATIAFAANIRGAKLYDGLGSNRLEAQGLFERLSEAGTHGGWTTDDLFVWEFPEQQFRQFNAPPARGPDGAPNFPRQSLEAFLQMLEGPFIPKVVDPKTGRDIVWDHPLKKARLLQATGDLSEAIREYNQIRQGVDIYEPVPLNGLCLESAVYWTTVCQYELGAYEAVKNMAAGQYPPNFRIPMRPAWARGMATLTAYSLARTGLLEPAADMYQQFSLGETPQQRHYLMQRWRRLAQAPTTAAPAGTAATGTAPSAAPGPSPTGSAPSTAPTPPTVPAAPAAGTAPTAPTVPDQQQPSRQTSPGDSARPPSPSLPARAAEGR